MSSSRSSRRGSSPRNSRRSDATQNSLPLMIVETYAKTLTAQLRLVLDGNPQQVIILERIEHYISQFFATKDSGLKGIATTTTSTKRKETKLDATPGIKTSKISEPTRHRRSSILMSQQATMMSPPPPWATADPESIKAEQSRAIDEFLRHETTAQNVLRRKSRMGRWSLVRQNTKVAVGGDDADDGAAASDEEQPAASSSSSPRNRCTPPNKNAEVKKKTPVILAAANASGGEDSSAAASNSVGNNIITTAAAASGSTTPDSSAVKAKKARVIKKKAGIVVDKTAPPSEFKLPVIGASASEQVMNIPGVEEGGRGEDASSAIVAAAAAGESISPAPPPATTATTPLPPPAVGAGPAVLLGSSSPTAALTSTAIQEEGLFDIMHIRNVAPPLLPPPIRYMWEEQDDMMMEEGEEEEDAEGSNNGTTANDKLVNLTRSTTVKERKGFGPAAETSYVSDVDALLLQATNKWYTFCPHNRKKAYWDFFKIVTVIYIAVLLPIRLAFDVHVSGFEKGLDVALDLFFIVDICINFMTGYIDPATKDVVLDSGKIARRYASSWLLLDVISSVPTDVIDAVQGDWESSSSGGALSVMKVFRMLRVLRMHSFKTLEMSGRANPNVIRILKFVAAFSFSLHFSACAYWAVSKSQGLGSTGWVPSEEFEESAFGDKYMKSLHYAFAAISSNDMKPETPSELGFSCCIMLIGLVVNATIIGSAASLLSNLNAGAVEKKKQLDGVREYMSFRKVPQSLQKRITEYYEYLWDCGQNSHNEDLFEDLPQSLHMHLRLCLSRELINNISLFQSLDPSVVLALVLRMEATITIPEEVIIREGEIGHCMYFINRGEVKVSISKGPRAKQVEIATLKKGSYFGEIALMDAEHERTATVTSASYCELYSLHHDEWMEIVEESRYGFFAAVKVTAQDRHRELSNFKKNQKKSSKLFMPEEKESSGRRGTILGAGRGFLATLKRSTKNLKKEEERGVFQATMKAAAHAENLSPGADSNNSSTLLSKRRNSKSSGGPLNASSRALDEQQHHGGGGGSGSRRREWVGSGVIRSSSRR